ncbi:MAG: GNAT family N-acetyltransferase, partial [Bacillota bacterium]
ALRMIGEGSLKGYLAYAACPGTQSSGSVSGSPAVECRNGRVVGWCNANDKRVYPHFSKVGEDGDSRVYAVTCYVIDPLYRRQGIARALLRRAVADAAAAGYDYFEAYPIEGGETQASHYHGHPELYENEGFTVRLRLGSRLCMRKSL